MVRSDLSSDGDRRWLVEQMQSCLESRGGDVSARARAAALGRTYLSLDAEGREKFLTLLAEDFDIDRGAVNTAARALEHVAPQERREAERVLRDLLEPPRLRLLTQFNALPEGVKFLVNLRVDLLPLARKKPALKAFDDDLKRLLNSWFDIGFLELRRITWESSAALLEKLIAYEAVHEIRGWDDLKDRLDTDRRCFAFFHPRMPDEPLIFVEVALVNGMANNVAALLDPKSPVLKPGDADSAIFYSISNAQRGLVGISFGGFLIKRVADLLAAELKGLKTFATLSPIPGFRKWLDPQLEADDDLLRSEEDGMLKRATGLDDGKAALRQILASSQWSKDEGLSEAIKPALMRLCAQYLVQEKASNGRARDPVAHFHLTNGARVERLNWLGDTSAHGMSQSAGLMVNYQYRLDKVEEFHEAYSGERKVTASPAVNRLL